jgi:hypothetical protein
MSSHFEKLGHAAALEKLGVAGLLAPIGSLAAKTAPWFGKMFSRPVMKYIGKGALVGGGLGALGGGITGLANSPEGEGLSGFARGAFKGGLTGALLGGAGRAIGAGKTIGTLPEVQVGGKWITPLPTTPTPAMTWGARGGAAGGLLGGMWAGNTLRPPEPSFGEQLQTSLG